MGSFEDFEPRMKKLERRLTDIWSDIQSMPPHAPLRKRRMEEFEKLSKEMESLRRDAFAAQGQETLFGEE